MNTIRIILLAVLVSCIQITPAFAQTDPFAPAGQGLNQGFVNSIILGSLGAFIILVLGISGGILLFVGGESRKKENLIMGGLCIVAGMLVFAYRMLVASGILDTMEQRRLNETPISLRPAVEEPKAPGSEGNGQLPWM